MVNLPISCGIGPASLLFARHNASNDEMLKLLRGNDPEMLFVSIAISIKLWRLPISSGIIPAKKIWRKDYWLQRKGGNKRDKGSSRENGLKELINDENLESLKRIDNWLCKRLTKELVRLMSRMIEDEMKIQCLIHRVLDWFSKTKDSF